MADRPVSAPPKLIGHMYLARLPCGKVVAAAWDEADNKKDTAASVARWIKRGNTVERVARYQGDPQPNWCCGPSEPCECRTPAHAATHKEQP